jgi:hypothetical protein
VNIAEQINVFENPILTRIKILMSKEDYNEAWQIFDEVKDVAASMFGVRTIESL